MEFPFEYQGDLVITFLGVLVAGATAWLTWFGVQAQKKLRQQYYLDALRVWASASMQDISEAMHLTLLEPKLTHDPSFYNRRHDLLVRLSARIDEGRWFFPNDEANSAPAKDHEDGDWQLSAYTGLRQRPVSALIYCYGAVRKMSYSNRSMNEELWHGIGEAKRAFTNDIQSMLDPRTSNKEYKLSVFYRDYKG